MEDINISVIIPVYNGDKFLHNCIESVLNQTYQNFEIVIVNDGSVDNSGYICDEYAKKYSMIRVYHQANKGVSAARNLGIEKAKGDWFYFMDADDTINADLFSIIECVDENTEVVQFGYNRIEKNIETVSYSPISNQLYSSADNFINNVTYTAFSLWVHFIKSSLIKENNIIFTEGQKYAEDLEFTIKAYACASGIMTSTFIGYNYFIHEGSTMSRAYTFENAVLHLSVAKRLINFCEINSKKNNDFLESRLEYMIKSYFSFGISANANKRELSKQFKHFIDDNKDNQIKKILNNGNLQIAKISPTIYMHLMSIKLRLYGL